MQIRNKGRRGYFFSSPGNRYCFLKMTRGGDARFGPAGRNAQSRRGTTWGGSEICKLEIGKVGLWPSIRHTPVYDTGGGLFKRYVHSARADWALRIELGGFRLEFWSFRTQFKGPEPRSEAAQLSSEASEFNSGVSELHLQASELSFEASEFSSEASWLRSDA